MTVYENIAFPLRLKKIDDATIDSEVKKFVKLVGLSEHINKMPNQLSGGQQQRVSIARALINKPGLLLLDEPLSALDAKLRQNLLIELDLIHEEVGITFIFITHDQQEALSISDRIAVMNKGEILQVGTPAEVYESPADSFVADFIGENNFFEGTVTEIMGEVFSVRASVISPSPFFGRKPRTTREGSPRSRAISAMAEAYCSESPTMAVPASSLLMR